MTPCHNIYNWQNEDKGMLQLKNIKKTYKIGEIETQALKGVSVAFREKEFVAILGTSGSGKTTCLNIIGGLDNYTDGDLILNGKSTKDFTEKDWNSYRNNSIGFIFQSYNLIGHLSIVENVELGMTLSGVSAKESNDVSDSAYLRYDRCYCSNAYICYTKLYDNV